ncbi:hypothetical protein L204_100093 [Cryptococcus depauperatus]|nr:WD repeat-containing protein [Cryptococcus depauperatus CBS 7855]
MDEETAYEIERQNTIAENRALLDSLGLEPTNRVPLSSPPVPSKVKIKPAVKKRKAPPAPSDEGPRRRSGRLAGQEVDEEELKVKLEEEEHEREVLRVVNRKERAKIMNIGKMVEETLETEIKEMEDYLESISKLSNQRTYPPMSTSAKESYTDHGAISTEVQRLKDAFTNMRLEANAKVTNERVFSMVVHPERSKTLVFVGDKYGQLGIWDALGPPMDNPEMEDDTNGVQQDEDQEGIIWRVQAHAKNSISCMKVDPVNGSGLFSSAYDCSLRHLDFATLRSTELFAFQNEDMLVNHFDLVPSGKEAWIVDKNGGISHCDFREGRNGRRRWVVQEEGRGAKLGGISVNPLMPHLVCTAGNDQHVRIWDTRYLLSIAINFLPTPPPTATDGFDLPETNPTHETDYDAIVKYLGSAKGRGLMRAKWQHGKSCSSAYWDPWGRRILTTSYDDNLRIFNVNPQSLLLDTPLPSAAFNPTKTLKHNCQTGRWLTILRAQWSLNMDYMPHFTVGNMKRTLDVVSASGEKICALWTDAVTAVPTVTTSHPNIIGCVLGGNTSGRIQLWLSGGKS